ncbi:MAG TPA: hypothetical protein VJ972_06795 [Anaerolineales bacterium]|nr:hypothetical protein [Anaerolineales bacterium]
MNFGFWLFCVIADIFNFRVETTSLEPVFDPDLLDGITKIDGQTTMGEPITLVPYHLWGNRGESAMTVWTNK